MSNAMASLLSISLAAAVMVKQGVTAEALHPSIITRILQDDGGGDGDGDGSSPMDEPDSGSGMGDDRFQFVAFLLWYIFLVFCCVVPTCCAYHRRRRVEQRLAVQQANLNRLQHSNLFILSNLQRHSINNERVQQERLRILTEKLKETTMTIKDGDLIESSPPDTMPSEEGAPETAITTTATTDSVECEESAMENGEASLSSPTNNNEANEAGNPARDNDNGALEYAVDEFAEDNGVMHLPNDKVNADRTVPSTCAICLCPYQDGEKVTWSTESNCVHCFHSSCILPWLSKREEPQCPVCRQEFCSAAAVEAESGSSSASYRYHDNTSFLESFSQAFALSQFYRQEQNAPGSSPEMNARRANQLELRNVAMRQHFQQRAVVLREEMENHQNRRQSNVATNSLNDADAGGDEEEATGARVEEGSSSAPEAGDSGTNDTTDDEPPVSSLQVGAGTDDERQDASNNNNNSSTIDHSDNTT